MGDKAKEVLDLFPPHLRNDLEEAMGKLREFNKSVEEDIASVPEEVFVKHLLPILTNRTGSQNLSIWQDIAGHAFRSINVVDKDGNILFNCPALFTSPDKQITGKGQHSAYEVISTAIKKSDVLPALGVQHMKQHFISKLYDVKAPIEKVVAWNRILVHYGHPPLIKSLNTEKLNVSVIESKKPSDIDIDGFEDL